MVLFTHVTYGVGFVSRYAGGPGWRGVLADTIARFDVSVPMFFVLSGFLLYRPFARSSMEGGRRPDTRSFYRARALRIAPAYWAALAGLAVLSALTPVYDLGIRGVFNWVGNILTLPSFGVPVEVCTSNGCHVGYGITQAWSIGVEVGFYLALPLLAALADRFATRGGRVASASGLLATIAVLWLLGQAFRVFVVVDQPSWQRESLMWLPMFLDFFAVGMALAVLSARFGADGPPGAIRVLARHPWLCWSAVAVVIGIMTQFPPPAEPFGLSREEYLIRQFTYGVASALWLWPAIFGDQSAGLLRRFLAWRPLAYLGTISLSFYLWHVAFVTIAKWMTVPDFATRVEIEANATPDNELAGVATFVGNAAVVTVVTWGLSFVVAAVLFRFVERPLLERKHRPPRGAASVPGGSGAGS